MIQAADAFLKNDHEPAPLHGSVFYRHARVPLDELDICHAEQDEEKFHHSRCFLNVRLNGRGLSHVHSCPYL